MLQQNILVTFHAFSSSNHIKIKFLSQPMLYWAALVTVRRMMTEIAFCILEIITHQKNPNQS